MDYFDSLYNIKKNLTNDYKCCYINVNSALNMILADDIFSSTNIPKFNNSAVDGFALRYEDALYNDIFNIVGINIAGSKFIESTFLMNSCIEIMTGAIIPSFFDTVVPLENVVYIDYKKIKLKTNVLMFQNIKYVGADIIDKELIIKKGTLIQAKHIMILCMIGIKMVLVYNIPKILLICTGNELLNKNNNKIYNANGPYIISYLYNLGINIDKYLVLSDDKINILNILLEFLNTIDLVIITGGVSKGKYDFIRKILSYINSQIYFHGLNIRPCKPILFSKYCNTYFFGIPGNPIASMIGIRFFVCFFLRVFYFLSLEKSLTSRLCHSVIKNHNLTIFYRGYLFFLKNNFFVYILNNQESYKVKNLIYANVWVVLHANTILYKKNDLVDVYYIEKNIFL